jgi:hypothetical protein
MGLALLACGFAYPAATSACSARSGPNTAALVELYTSAGCAACRAAERRLAELASKPQIVHLVIPYELAPGAVPRRFTLGQRLALTPAPRVLLQGEEFPGWATAALDEALERILSRPAQARLELRILGSTAEELRVRASAELTDRVRPGRAVLYLAAFSERPEKRLLDWEGPARFAGTRLELERALALAPGALGAKSGVAAVVQNRRTGEVLQALSLTTCS